ncbi:MAG: DUF3429 domain-containing protein [Alphaproteobacteria bacterium]
MLRNVPVTARVCGLSGLLPFIASSLAIWSGDPVWESEAMTFQLTYGAAILSFLGGIHWARAFSGDDSWATMSWAVLPPLIAWITLRLYPAPALFVLIFAFALAYFIDLRAVRAGAFPDWFLPLRKVLTVGVILCLGSTLFWAFYQVR